MKLLTLAIASYNMEQYLDRCLKSITAESIPNTLEVIIVNDGSKDRTSEIAHHYEQKYPEIIKVIDKENGHYGSCINKALEISTGKFFRPLDADDWMNSEALVNILNKLDNCEADLIVTSFSKINKTTITTISIPSIIKLGQLYDAKKLSFKDNKLDMLLSMHSMTFKTELLKNIPLKLKTGISYTDTQYCMMPIDKIKNVIFYDYNLYQYDISRDGQTMQKNILIQSYKSFYILSEELGFHYINNCKTNNEIVKSNQRCFLGRVLYYFYISILVYNKELNDEQKAMLQRIKELVAKDKQLKTNSHFTFKGIPFVKIWNLLNIRIFKYLPN